MFKIPCRCGERVKAFQNNIGPFYIEECCEARGFDASGNKTEASSDALKQETDEKEAEKLSKELEKATKKAAKAIEKKAKLDAESKGS